MDKGGCKVKNVQLGVLWRQCFNEAERVHAIQLGIGTEGRIVIFGHLFSEGATLLKPKGRSLQKAFDEQKDVCVVEEKVSEAKL